MKKIILSLCFILIIVILNHDYGKAESKKEIINIKKNIDPKLISQFKQDLNSNKIEYDYLNEINLIIIKNDNDISAILEKYKNIISSNGHPSKITSDSLTSDEFKNYNWYLDKIFINNMYQNSKNNYSNIKVGVIDSGVHSNGLNVDKTNSKNYTSEDRINIKDDTGHGTMVANMVNTVAPNVKLSIYKVINENKGDSSDIVKAIVDASNNKLNVINISLGTYKGLTNLEDRQTVEMYDRAIKFAQSKQVIIVASAGNRGQRLVDNSSTHLPGGHPEIITVGSTLRDNTVANYSNYGENLKIVAPGGYLGTEFDINKNIDVTHMLITKFPDYLEQNPIDKALNLTRGYSLNFGTSLSTPQVTGAIVRLKYDNSNLSNKTIIKKLYKNALDIESIGRDIKSGYGLLQIKR